MQQNQHRDRRLKPGENNQNQTPPSQPQKCPRCDSLNTKFCYYNNYSLSQPRYFCKTCRRYWTQGGTLRNVPVGGGCRKGKRIKTSSSSGDSSRSNLSNNIIAAAANPGLRLKDVGNHHLASPSGISSQTGSSSFFYPGHGFMSSLAAVQSLHQPSGFNHQLPLVSDNLGGSSNLGMFQGYKTFSPSYGLQGPHTPSIPQTQFYFGNREEKAYTIEPKAELAPQQQNWQHNFSTNVNPTAVSDTGLWSINSAAAATTTNTNNITTSSAPQWPDLPGYGAPPP